MYRRRQFLAAIGAIGSTVGCLDRTDDCYMWGLSFSSDTEVHRAGEDRWRIDGELRALFSPSSPIEVPYETAYSDVSVVILSDGETTGRREIGTVSIDDGESSDSDCIDTLASVPFSIDLDAPPTRITVDCTEFPDLCANNDDVREYVYTGSSDHAGRINDGTWENRKRPCDEDSLG